MGVATPIQPDHTSQTDTVYKTNIDGSISVLKRFGFGFAPHEQATPNMTVRVDAGVIFAGGNSLQAIAAQNSATITAPTSNPRIDRIVMDRFTGSVSVVTGTEAASPSAPAIPWGKVPICQVALVVNQTSIVNADLTDERVMDQLGRSYRDINIAEYGKLGMAGSNDDSIWESARAEFAASVGGRIWVPEGRTKLNLNQLGLASPNIEVISIDGVNRYASILQPQDTTIPILACPSNNLDLFVRNMRLSKTANTDVGLIDMTSGRLNLLWSNLDGDNLNGALVRLLSQAANTARIIGNLFQNAGASGGSSDQIGIHISGANAAMISMNAVVNNKRSGVEIGGTDAVGNVIANNVIDSNGTDQTIGQAGILIGSGASKNIIMAEYMEDNRPSQIAINADGNFVCGVSFHGSGQTNDVNVAGGSQNYLIGLLGTSKPVLLAGSRHVLAFSTVGSLTDSSTDTMVWGVRTAAGALVANKVPEDTNFARGLTTGNVSIKAEEGTWTPVLTFVTPGNLSVTYSTRVGTYHKIGKLVTAFCSVTLSAFTHTTASGNLRITGLPFASENVAGRIAVGAVRWAGITKANYTDIVAQIEPNDSVVEFVASGSAQGGSFVGAADMPTGGTPTLILRSPIRRRRRRRSRMRETRSWHRL